MDKKTNKVISLIVYALVLIQIGFLIGVNVKTCDNVQTKNKQAEMERLIFIRANNEYAYNNGWINKKQLDEYQSSINKQIDELEEY